MNKHAGAGKTSADKDAEYATLQEQLREARGIKPDSSAWLGRLQAALARLTKATPRSPASLRGFNPMPGGGGLEFDPGCTEAMMLPPQVTETLVRGDVTVTVGDPNVGKSQLLSATAMAVAYNAVAELLGEAGDGWLGAVLFASNEERPSYVRARWKELAKLLPPEKLKKHDKLVLWDKRLVLGRFDDGVIVPTEECCEFVERLADWAEQGTHFAYIGLDPLSTLFAGIKENDSVQTGDAVRFMKQIATAAYTSIEVSHHTSKATRGQETATASRGSTGTEAASDIMGTLIILPASVHDALGFPPDKIDMILRRKGVRSRGKRAGETYFEREIITVPAEDERYPGVLTTGTVAVLKPVARPRKPGVILDNVQRWLWEANKGAGAKRLTRGQKMAGHRGVAVVLVMEKGGCDRQAAEGAIDELKRLGRVVFEDVWIKSHLRPVVVPKEPAAVSEAADETDGPY